MYYEYKPVQEPDGTWLFRKYTGKASFPVGWCIVRGCQHKTPVEVSNCYKDYLISERGACMPGGQYFGTFEYGTVFEFTSNH